MTRAMRGVVMVGLTVVAVVGGLVEGALAQDKLEKLTLAYSVPNPGSDSTYLFAGKQLGFFKEQGVDLTIQPTQGSVASFGFIASGAVDIALGTLETLPGYVLQGVPIRVVYLYVHRPIYALGLFKDGKVQRVADLKGKKVGVSALGSGAVPVLQYMLKEAGLALTDVSLVPIGVGPSAVAAIKRGDVEAVMFWDTAYANYRAQGIDLQLVSSPKLQQAYAGLGFFALEKTLASRRNTIEAFLRGITKSLAFATKNPEAATRAFAALHPEVGKNPRLEQAIWEERLKIQVLPPAARGQWGFMEPVQFENMLDVLMLAGLIKEKPPVEKLYTLEFLKAANAVDLSPIR